MNRRIILAAAVALAAVAAGILVQSARATYPGEVGRPAMATNVGGRFTIATDEPHVKVACRVRRRTSQPTSPERRRDE